jgi:hypothetical protein
MPTTYPCLPGQANCRLTPWSNTSIQCQCQMSSQYSHPKCIKPSSGQLVKALQRPSPPQYTAGPSKQLLACSSSCCPVPSCACLCSSRRTSTPPTHGSASSGLLDSCSQLANPAWAADRPIRALNTVAQGSGETGGEYGEPQIEGYDGLLARVQTKPDKRAADGKTCLDAAA